MKNKTTRDILAVTLLEKMDAAGNAIHCEEFGIKPLLF